MAAKSRKKAKNTTADEEWEGHIRLPQDVRGIIESLAKEAERSFPKQVIFMLKTHPLVLTPEKAPT